MNDMMLVSAEEERNIRAGLRAELEEKLRQQAQQSLETRTLRAKEEKDKVIASIRHDEEVRFYTAQGYVSSTRALDDTLDWFRPEKKDDKRRRRRRDHKKHTCNNKNKFKKHLKDILFVLIALAGILALYFIAH